MGWKIVRDNQRERNEKDNISGSYRTAVDPVAALGKKLFEEASEFMESYDPGELYDLLDVLSELLHLLDPHGYAETAHALKIAEHGLFSTHLEWTPKPDEV